MRLIIYFTFTLFTAVDAPAQTADSLTLSLPEVVELAKLKSIESKQAITTRETRYWQYRTYRSNYQPQLSLNGTLPGYSKTFAEVQQPDGSIRFQSIRNNNSTLNLSFSQSIAATGGMVYGTTQLQRFDDFDRKNVLYNGVPFGIGYAQPMFQFNPLRWDKKIEPLRYKESKQEYLESMEQIAIRATGYYFDLLLAQVNLQIAETNLANTNKIQTIAAEKYQLGKLSKNEMLQLELEALKAEKAIGVAKREKEIATLNLRAYTGLENTIAIILGTPASGNPLTISSTKVLEEAYENRSDATAFARRMAEAKRDIAKAKGDNGLNIALTAQLGFSKSANTIPKVYQSPQNQQEIQLVFSIPIVDWGRSKSRTKTAEANMQFTQYAVEQDMQLFNQEIVTQVTLYDMMKEQLQLTEKADEIASEKYQIARERYVLGNLSITDLSIAFAEKDQAKRDYIIALRNYWTAHYQLRYLSLYDFEKNEKIQYN